MKKILFPILAFLLGTLLFTACSKDELKDTLEDTFQLSDVTIKNGSDTTFSNNYMAAIGASTGSISTVTASSTTDRMVVYMTAGTGTKAVAFTIDELVNLNLSQIVSNAVIVFAPDGKKYMMTQGTINVTSFSGNTIVGSFTGSCIDISDLSISVITDLYSAPLSINGKFSTLNVGI